MGDEHLKKKTRVNKLLVCTYKFIVCVQFDFVFKQYIKILIYLLLIAP